MDRVFWMAEVVDRGHEVEVMCWLDLAGDGLSIPRTDRMVAWSRGTGELDEVVRGVLTKAGLIESEITGQTDPIVGRSWLRGIAQMAEGNRA